MNVEMENNKIEIEKQKLIDLLEQNKEMKDLLTKGYSTIAMILKLLNLNKVENLKSFNLTLKLPLIIRTINENKNQFSDILNSDFLNKIEKYVTTNDTGDTGDKRTI
jgi:hypothetical protein